MRRVPAADFVRNFSELSDEALRHPVTITRKGRDRLVLESVEHYRQLLSLALSASKDQHETQQLDILLKGFG